MRLLKRDRLENVSFTDDLDEKDIPEYAILSHTWGTTADEVTFEDIISGTGTSKPGYGKIRFCIQQTEHDGLEYFWVDTCCIDKKNNTELSRALISMFRWYSNAKKCYVLLSDVPKSDSWHSDKQASKSWKESFRESRWFKRGWTLQELLAPPSLEFFFSNGDKFGTKDSLRQMISEITKIPTGALDGESLANFTIQERLAWQENRETKEEEDMIYSLLGIFNVSMPILYGEGRTKAQARLQKELFTDLTDESQAPKPTHNLPFLRDPAFVHRAELNDINEKFLTLGARVALVGLGGVGKSQLAIEYCYQLREQSQDIWVFWIHSSSAARFDQDIQKLAEDVKIPGRQDKNANIFQLVCSWLKDNRRSWFIVLDNVDDASFLIDPPPMSNEEHSSRPRIEYLPICAHGRIFITTRRQSVASSLADSHYTIPIQPDKDHSIEILKSKLAHLKHDESIEKLAAALEYMPLAIVQAAAYINKRMPRCSIEEYLAKFEKSDRSKSSLLKIEVSELRRDRLEAKNSILLTWQISFEHIHDKERSAADLLSLMSFFDYQGIPEILVRLNMDQESLNPIEEGTGEHSDSSGADSFEHDLDVLRDFSLISVTGDGSVFQMHRLVQLAAQVWLKEKEQYHYWLAVSLQKLDDIYPLPSYDKWRERLNLQPHALLVRKIKTDEPDSLVYQASILYRSGWTALFQGSYQVAEAMTKQSLHIYTSLGYSEHIAALNCMSSLAMTYQKQGRWPEAEDLYGKATEIGKMRFGVQHMETLRNMTSLAGVHLNQGRWKKAEELQLEALEIQRTMYGEENPETIRSLSDLALIYTNQGKWREAEELQLKVLETGRTVNGAKHPDTLISMNNLANTHAHRKNYKAAEELHLEVLETRRTLLGAEHPNTLGSMNNLATLYAQQGRLNESEEIRLKALPMMRHVFGAEHPLTLRSLSNLATTYSSQEKWKETEELRLKVLEISKRVLGLEHPDTLLNMYDLAVTYCRQRKQLSEAQTLLESCLEAQIRVIGAEHPDTRNTESWIEYISAITGEVTEEEEEGPEQKVMGEGSTIENPLVEAVSEDQIIALRGGKQD